MCSVYTLLIHSERSMKITAVICVAFRGSPTAVAKEQRKRALPRGHTCSWVEWWLMPTAFIQVYNNNNAFYWHKALHFGHPLCTTISTHSPNSNIVPYLPHYEQYKGYSSTAWRWPSVSVFENMCPKVITMMSRFSAQQLFLHYNNNSKHTQNFIPFWLKLLSLSFSYWLAGNIWTYLAMKSLSVVICECLAVVGWIFNA